MDYSGLLPAYSVIVFWAMMWLLFQDRRGDWDPMDPHDWPDPVLMHFWKSPNWRNGRDSYYDKLGNHWFDGAGIEDWRVLEIAIEYGLDPELALSDAVNRGFVL